MQVLEVAPEEFHSLPSKWRHEKYRILVQTDKSLLGFVQHPASLKEIQMFLNQVSMLPWQRRIHNHVHLSDKTVVQFATETPKETNNLLYLYNK